MANLYNVDSPINREQRNNINATFSDIQQQIGNVVLNTGNVQSQLQQSIDFLQSQINSIITEEGNTNAEVIQARNGYNGNNYPTLKVRLDTEIQEALNNSSLVKATTQQAQEGTDDEAYMTPLKVNQVTVKKTSTRVSNVEFNDFRTEGEYAIGSNVTVNGNAFTNGQFGTLKVLVSNDVVSQILYNYNGSQYYRSLTAISNPTQPVFVRTSNPNISIDSVGQVSSLLTQNKATTVAAINELFQDVDNGKNLIASAITDKGVPTQGTATFQQMASNINVISADPPQPVRGIVRSSTVSGVPFMNYNGTVMNSPSVTVSGIGFIPNRIEVTPALTNSPVGYIITSYYKEIGYKEELISLHGFSASSTTATSKTFLNNQQSAYVNSTGFRLPVDGANLDHQWVAYP